MIFSKRFEINGGIPEQYMVSKQKIKTIIDEEINNDITCRVLWWFSCNLHHHRL